MQKEIDKIDFDIAILGCGAYGYPLASYIKSIGKKAIHIGGATQLIFGIKGKRWEKASFINEKVFPSAQLLHHLRKARLHDLRRAESGEGARRHRRNPRCP